MQHFKCKLYDSHKLQHNMTLYNRVGPCFQINEVFIFKNALQDLFSVPSLEVHTIYAPFPKIKPYTVNNVKLCGFISATIKIKS